MTSFRFFLGLLVLAIVGESVPAQLPVKEVESHCERRFSVGLNDYEPFAYREKGRLTGLATDIVSLLKEKTGCQFVEEEISRPAAAEQIASGRIDLLALMVKSTQYEPGGVFLPIYESHRELTVTKSVFVKGKSIEGYLADSKIKFAYMIGSRSVITAKEEQMLLKSSRLIGVPGPKDAFRLLKEGRVQAVLFSALVTSYYKAKTKMQDQVETVVDLATKVPVGFYVSRRRVSEAEKKMLVDAIEDLKKDGSLLRVLSRYMSRTEAVRRVGS